MKKTLTLLSILIPSIVNAAMPANPISSVESIFVHQEAKDIVKLSSETTLGALEHHGLLILARDLLQRAHLAQANGDQISAPETEIRLKSLVEVGVKETVLDVHAEVDLFIERLRGWQISFPVENRMSQYRIQQLQNDLEYFSKLDMDVFAEKQLESYVLMAAELLEWVTRLSHLPDSEGFSLKSLQVSPESWSERVSHKIYIHHNGDNQALLASAVSANFPQFLTEAKIFHMGFEFFQVGL